MPRKPPGPRRNRKPENRAKQAVDRKPDGTFAEGVSGNAGGRPTLPKKLREYLDANADEMTIEVLEALRKWARNDYDGRAAVAAGLGLLKKTLPDGAVAIKVEMSGPDGGPVQTKVVTLDDSPGSLARVVAVLRATGLLDAGAGESADAEDDAVDSAKPD